MQFRVSRSTLAAVLFLVVAVHAFGQEPTGKKAPLAQKSSAAARPTAADAAKFVADAEKRLADINVKGNRADWVQSNFITDDTEAIAADAEQENTALSTKYALAATKYEGLKLP